MRELVLVIHVVGYFVVIGVLAGYTENKHDAKYVFTHFENSTGWESDFASWSISLLTSLYAYLSIDTATHFSEEIPNANVLVPRASRLQIRSLVNAKGKEPVLTPFSDSTGRKHRADDPALHYHRPFLHWRH